MERRRRGFNWPKETDEKLDALSTELDLSQTAVIQLALDLLYAQRHDPALQQAITTLARHHPAMRRSQR